jgi:hypothetical protein
VLFPVGFADDVLALALGYASFRKATKPWAVEPSRN